MGSQDHQPYIFYGQHTFLLTRNADGSTHLDNTETFSGALIWPLKGMFKQNEKRRANGYDGFNQALKRRVEARLANEVEGRRIG